MRSLFLAMLFAAAGCTAQAPPLEPPVSAAPAVLASGNTPTTALSDEGAFVTFFREDDGATNLYLSRHDVSWDAPTRVNSNLGDASAHGQAPGQVAVAPDGSVYVAWTNAIPIEGRRFPASNLFVARSTDGGRSFSSQRPVNSDYRAANAGHTFHDLAVGPDGSVYVSWLDGRRREAEVAAGAEPEGTGTEVFVAVSRDGGQTFQETVVAKGSCQCCRTSLAVALDGTVYLAWRHVFGDNVRDMALAVSRDGGASFQAPTRIHNDGWTIDGCPHSGPSLAVDDAGGIHVGWFTGAEGRVGLYYAYSQDGNGFSEPLALLQNTPVSQIKLAAGAGAIRIAYEDRLAGLTRFAEADFSGGVRLVEATLAGEAPAISAAGDRFLVATQQKDGIAVHGRWGPAGSGPLAQIRGARKPMPAFSGVTPEGTPVQIGSGQPPTLVNLWATWCGPCIAEFPEIEALHKELDGLRVVAVNVDELDAERIRKFAQDLGITFTVALDPEQDYQDRLLASAVPSSYLVDSQGRLVASWAGVLREPAFRTIRAFMNDVQAGQET